MCIRNLIAAISLLIASGCAPTYAPVGWLPDTDEIQSEAFGGWMRLTVENDSLTEKSSYVQYDGEFISSDESSVYLLADSLFIIPKEKISYSYLEINAKNSTSYGLWVFGGIISTISNGYFLIITAPLWLLTGVPAAAGESVRDTYEYKAEINDDTYWIIIQQFARFPQGLPEGLDLDLLSPKLKLDKPELQE